MIVEIYTDGSCDANHPQKPMGYAAVLRAVDKDGNLLKRQVIVDGAFRGTSQIAEIRAVKIGLQALTKSNMEVIIYTDSQYVAGIWSGNKVNANHQEINNMRAEGINHRITVKHLRGHSGHPENEEAHNNAKEMCVHLRELANAEDNETPLISHKHSLVVIELDREEIAAAVKSINVVKEMSTKDSVFFFYADNKEISLENTDLTLEIASHIGSADMVCLVATRQ